MNVLRPVAIRLGAQAWLPRFAHLIVGLDRWMQRLSRGRLTLLMLAGLPELMLTVPGRRSGLPRSTPLLYVPHPGGHLVAGSNWGHPKPPVWVANLAAADRATVTIHGRQSTVVPRRVTGAEREQVWQHMLETWPNYAKYAERTTREIPVFLLEPLS
ncbi:MAG TPA: nitroreductase family deazaflavin-dependent oxidoreductase [Marmoricola sp.]|nr:nitroreductase family deazaflavin-dependent oxidoreductase [Marmoricola sp.]